MSDVESVIKRLLMKDLRIQCRQRKLSPAGSMADLRARLKENMLETNNFAMYNEDGSVMGEGQTNQLYGIASRATGNNYVRPDGQNVGNFLGDRPSSRVLAAPGGKSNMNLGHDTPSAPVSAAKPAVAAVPEPVSPTPATPPAPKAAKSRFLTSMTAKIAGHAVPPGVAKAPTKAPPAEKPSEEAASVASEGHASAEPSEDMPTKALLGTSNNNYNRPSGQNVGNFLTDRPSSRVLAPPGGSSSLRLG